MIGRVLALGVILWALIAWDRSLIEEDAAARTRATETVGRVLSQEAYETLELAAIRLEFGDGRPTLTFAPISGTWRCVEAFQAPADVAALESLIAAVTTAEGYVQSDDPAQAGRYGIGAADGVRFSICGPKVLSDPSGDVQWSCDLGSERPGGDGSFLRVAGSSEVWAVDKTPRALLDAATLPGIPPLVDSSILGKSWLAAARGIDRVFVDYADGTFFELATRPREVTEEEMRAGVPPFEWVLDLATDPEPLPMGRAMAYVFHLQSCHHTGVLDPRTAQQLGYGGRETAKITVFGPTPPAGSEAPPPPPPIVLHMLPPMPDGTVPVVNPSSNAVYRLSAETAGLLQATREALRDAGAPNPWDAAVRKLTGTEDH